MPSYRVVLTQSAKKEFDRLPSRIQNRVVEALQFLSTNPYSELLKIKRLRGAPSLFRVRVGDYRVVYEVQNERLVVLVIKIGHRSDVYRRLT